jgi:GMP synthase-like glutamine amidotransferase
MRALIVQHEHGGGGPGLVGDRLIERGFELVQHQVKSEGSTESHHPFPDPTDFDIIVPLGSVHGVYERHLIGTWIDREVAMLRQAHDSGVPVLGICFGAQALTTALGGTVEKAPASEVGWYEYDSDLPDAIDPGPWLTWHGDRCLLPGGVTELARNELCTQAFRLGRSVGVQFHPESTASLIGGWVADCPPGYFEAHGTTAEAVMAGFDVHGVAVEQRARRLFDWFLDEVAPS